MLALPLFALRRLTLQVQVNKVQAGYERFERLPQGSESRATIAHDLVCCDRPARPPALSGASPPRASRPVQVNECDGVLWQVRSLWLQRAVLLLLISCLNRSRSWTSWTAPQTWLKRTLRASASRSRS